MKKMKKATLFLAVITLMVIGLASCGNKTNKTNEVTPTDSTTVVSDSSAVVTDSTTVAVPK